MNVKSVQQFILQFDSALCWRSGETTVDINVATLSLIHTWITWSSLFKVYSMQQSYCILSLLYIILEKQLEHIYTTQFENVQLLILFKIVLNVLIHKVKFGHCIGKG